MTPIARYAIAAVLIEAALIGLVALDTPFRSIGAFLALQSVAVLGFAIALAPAWRGVGGARGAWALLAIGVVFRATLVPFPHADDVHRYVWEGRIQSHGANPFAMAPDDPRLAPQRDATVYPGINHKEHTAIYPPLAQLLFRGLAACGAGFGGFKVAFIALDLLTALGILVLLRRRGLPATRVAVYAWCPLVLFAIAGRGHVDAMQTCAIVWAIVAHVSGRPGTAGLVLGCAVMSKTLAILLVPAFLLHERRPWRLWPIVIPLGLYALYADAGFGLVRSLWMFGTEWTTNASLYPILTALGGAPLVYATAGLVLAVALLRARRVDDAAFATLAAFTLFSPTVHPWYLVGLVPFLAMRWRPAWLVLCATVFAYYSFLTTGDWLPVPWVAWVEYVPFYACLAATAALGAYRARSGKSVSRRAAA